MTATAPIRLHMPVLSWREHSCRDPLPRRVSASRPMVESADRVERGRPAIEPVLSDAEDEEIMLPEDTDIAEPSTYSERNRKSPRRKPVNVETPDCNFRAFKRYAGPFAPF